MASAFQVARSLVRLAANEEEPDYLTHLRLQKLLYYIQAWSMVMRGHPMFPERIEAWANGPVVRDLFARFNDLGHRPILPEDIDAEAEIELSEEDREFVASVWDSYKGFSVWSLRQMTLEEAPWIDARQGYGAVDRCDVEITTEAMRDYFAALAN